METKTPRFNTPCSFCGSCIKTIAGPDVYICAECVLLCRDILDEENEGAGSIRKSANDQLEHLLSMMNYNAQCVYWLTKEVVQLRKFVRENYAIGLTHPDAEIREFCKKFKELDEIDE